MESVFVQSLSLAKIPKSQTSSLLNSPLLLHSNSTSVAFSSVPHHHLPKCFLFQSPGGVRSKAKEKQNLGIVHASEAAGPTINDSERWFLEPVGDGDTRHIGFKVEMPGAYEIASSEVTVGRVPEKADLVIPVATVSGVHARIQKKQGNLLVTDLDSTNGTFINDKRLRPGVVATVSPGSCITFGDTHLAMFRVSKVEDVTTADTVGETEIELDTDNKRDNTETS
ncbi:Zeaxanthin epoxidase [Spatholobus suberectus]|nr:Zeaxanthin epoxidase [Spatholobus suberectus]